MQEEQNDMRCEHCYFGCKFVGSICACQCHDKKSPKVEPQEDWEERLNQFQLRANQDKDSGYCGGCSYYQVKLKDFIRNLLKEERGKLREKIMKLEVHICKNMEIQRGLIYRDDVLDLLT